MHHFSGTPSSASIALQGNYELAPPIC